MVKKFYSKEDILRIKKEVDIREVMHHFGEFEDKEGKFICPNPEHNDHNPSAQYVKEKTLKDGKKIINCLCCFSCKGGFVNIIDNIQAFAWLSGLDKTNDFIKILNELENLNKSEFKKIEKAEIKTITTNEKEQDEFDFRVNISKNLHQLHLDKNYVVDTYFQRRAINYLRVKGILERNNIEIRHNFFNNINTLYIVDYNKRVIFQRQMEDYLRGKEGAPNEKYITGSTTFTYLKNNDNVKVLMIFEGFYDMLSYISYGLNIKDVSQIDYISLNSVNNIERNAEELQEIMKKYDLVLTLCDNDPAGAQANKDLKKLCGNRLEFITPYYEDWNEQLIKEREEEKKQKNGIKRF